MHANLAQGPTANDPFLSFLLFHLFLLFDLRYLALAQSLQAPSGLPQRRQLRRALSVSSQGEAIAPHANFPVVAAKPHILEHEKNRAVRLVLEMRKNSKMAQNHTKSINSGAIPNSLKASAFLP